MGGEDGNVVHGNKIEEDDFKYYMSLYKYFEKNFDRIETFINKKMSGYSSHIYLVLKFKYDDIADDMLETKPENYRYFTGKILTSHIKEKWGHLGDYGFYDAEKK